MERAIWGTTPCLENAWLALESHDGGMASTTLSDITDKVSVFGSGASGKEGGFTAKAARPLRCRRDVAER